MWRVFAGVMLAMLTSACASEGMLRDLVSEGWLIKLQSKISSPCGFGELLRRRNTGRGNRPRDPRIAGPWRRADLGELSIIRSAPR
jgi:hypothetical protein